MLGGDTSNEIIFQKEKKKKISRSASLYSALLLDSTNQKRKCRFRIFFKPMESLRFASYKIGNKI